MWKPEHRRAAERRGLRYPSDLTDAEWALVEPMIPPAKRGGRRREVNVREVLNAVFYVLSTGCQWQALPKDLPPKSTLGRSPQRKVCVSRLCKVCAGDTVAGDFNTLTQLTLMPDHPHKLDVRAKSFERNVFPLRLDARPLEELLSAGKYDWIADYARQIVYATSAARETDGEIEIVLLETEARADAFNLDGYQRPDTWDALRFGEQYPQEQYRSPIAFPHQPCAGPSGSSFVLALRSIDNKERGLSYVVNSSLLNEWWPSRRIAVRKRCGNV